MFQNVKSFFKDCVLSCGNVLLRHVDLDIGLNAKLGELSIGPSDRSCRESNAPSVGQFASEWQSTSTTGDVAHDGDVRQRLHDRDEIVGGAERAAVGKHHDGLVVVNPAMSRLKVVIIGLGELVVPLSSFVLNGAGVGSLVDESSYQCFDVGELATSIVSHIDNQAVACGKRGEHDIEVSVANVTSEVAIVHVGVIVVEDTIFYS